MNFRPIALSARAARRGELIGEPRAAQEDAGNRTDAIAGLGKGLEIRICAIVDVLPARGDPSGNRHRTSPTAKVFLTSGGLGIGVGIGPCRRPLGTLRAGISASVSASGWGLLGFWTTERGQVAEAGHLEPEFLGDPLAGHPLTRASAKPPVSRNRYSAGRASPYTRRWWR